MMRTLLICLLAVVVFADEDLPFGVRGKILCDGVGVSKAKVALKDHYSFFPDVSLSGGLTSDNGEFFIATMLKKVSFLDAFNPFLEIRNKCGFLNEHCQRFWLGKDAVEVAGEDHILEVEIELNKIKFEKC